MTDNWMEAIRLDADAEALRDLEVMIQRRVEGSLILNHSQLAGVYTDMDNSDPQSVRVAAETDREADRLRNFNKRSDNSSLPTGPGPCPKCGGPTTRRKDDNGPFWRCIRDDPHTCPEGTKVCYGWRKWNIDNKAPDG